MTFQITIIGLDITGASIGLALGEHKDKIVRVGHDRSFEKSKKAQKAGAFDRVENNLPDAVAQADLILLCEPFPQVIETIQHLAPELNQGKYLFNIGTVHEALNRKVEEIAPTMQHALNMYLTVNPARLGEKLSTLAEPSADAFKDGLMVIATTAHTSAEAVDLANTLAGILKTGILFCDPVELEGLIAGAVQFPALHAAALYQTTHQASGWRETRKLTGPAYFAGGLTFDPAQEEAFTAAELFENRAKLVHWIDAEMEELLQLRSMLTGDEIEPFEKWWQQSAERRSELSRLRASGLWDENERPEIKIPSAKERFAKLFTFGKRNL